MAEVRRGAKINPDGLELNERVVQVNRVAKVVKGGRRFSFSALVVVGNEVDTVGVGHGKAKEVPVAIQKAVEDAKKNLFRVPKYRTTITHQVTGRSGAGRVFLKPASEGTGVIAGAGGYGFYMIGSDGSVDLTPEGLQAVLERPGVLDDVNGAPDSNNRTATEWVNTLLGLTWAANDELRTAVGDGPLITDDRPLPEYFILRRLAEPDAPRMTLGNLRALTP